MSLAAFGIFGLGLVAMAIGFLVALDFRGWASRLHSVSDAKATRWPNWIRRDEWSRSVHAIRLYGCGLGFASVLMVVGALPHAGGAIGQYVAVGAFFGFAGTWVAAWLGGFRFGWQSPHRWRYVAVGNIAVYALEFIIVGLSFAVSMAHS